MALIEDAAISNMFPQAAAWVPWLFVLVIAFAALSLLGFIAWIWMIVDCARREKFKNGDRVVWILLLLLTGAIGMLLYYFMELRKK